MAEKLGEQAIINPTRNQGEVVIDRNCMLLVNPTEAGRQVASAKKQGAIFYNLFHSNLWAQGHGSKKIFLAGPALGAPMAVMTMEKMIALGCQFFLVFGWCGALSAKLVVGDIFLPTWGEVGEGTSQYYSNDIPRADQDASAKVKKILASKGLSSTRGPIWTTDAPYRETTDLLASKRAKGVEAVDMEFTALANLATFRSVKMVAVYLVSDELYRETWQPGYVKPEFKKKSQRLISILNSNLYRL